MSLSSTPLQGVSLCFVLPAQEHYAALLDKYAPAGGSSTKGVRLSWVSYLANLALLFQGGQGALAGNADGRAIALSAVAEALANCPADDPETACR